MLINLKIDKNQAFRIIIIKFWLFYLFIFSCKLLQYLNKLKTEAVKLGNFILYQNLQPNYTKKKDFIEVKFFNSESSMNRN